MIAMTLNVGVFGGVKIESKIEDLIGRMHVGHVPKHALKVAASPAVETR